MRTLFAAIAALCLLASPAWAQVDVNPYMSTVVAPLAVTILSGVASAVLTLGFAWLRKKWGLDIEANHRAALHSALVSGINWGVSQIGTSVGPVPRIQVGNPLVRLAVEYVLRSVPDAVASLDLTEERIAQMVLSKIPQVMGETAPVPPKPVS